MKDFDAKVLASIDNLINVIKEYLYIDVKKFASMERFRFYYYYNRYRHYRWFYWWLRYMNYHYWNPKRFEWNMNLMYKHGYNNYERVRVNYKEYKMTEKKSKFLPMHTM